MRRTTALLKALLQPPKWVTALLPPAVFSVLIYLFLTDQRHSPVAYAVYALSAYSLTLWVLPLPRLLQRAKKAVLQRLTANPFGERYMHDLAFRGKVSLCQGTLINLAYVLFRAAVGIRYASAWFLSIAVYYLVLGLLRLSLILSYRRKLSAELRCYRRTGSLLLLLNVPMGVMITLMVVTDSGYAYPDYITYLSALYTFYTVIHSVIDLVRFRKLGSPILSAAKALNFVAALMSLLGLQTAMIAAFSTEGEQFRRTMNAITGGSVWFFVILISVYMLRRSRKMKDEVMSSEPLGE